MRGLQNKQDEIRIMNMQFQLGKYILATYLKKQQETGQLEMDFIVRVRQQNGKQLTFTISEKQQ